MERASIELEAIAMGGYNVWGVLDDPSREKKNCYAGRINAEKKKRKIMRVGLMLLEKQRHLSG